LDEAAQIMKEEDLSVVAEGHTDSIGSVSYNLKLSERRANSVRDYLITQGVPADRLEAKGFGKSQPVASNDTPEGRAMNRRVELHAK
jgi:OOP family OmpA-OmpF porin